MKSYPSKVKVEDLNVKYFNGGGDVMMAFRQSESLADVGVLPAFILAAIKEIEEIRKLPALFIMINKLPAGINVAVHTDTLKKPYKVERWHLPLQTNGEAWFEDTLNGKIDMAPGNWHGPVPYWVEHSAGNPGSTERIHLVVDLDTNGAEGFVEECVFKASAGAPKIPLNPAPQPPAPQPPAPQPPAPQPPAPGPVQGTASVPPAMAQGSVGKVIDLAAANALQMTGK